MRAKTIKLDDYKKRLTNTVTKPQKPITTEEIIANCKRLELLIKN